MIFRGRSVDITDQSQVSSLAILLVRPNLVCPQIRRVEVRFRGIKDHAMDAGFGTVLIVLYVRSQASGLVDGEDVAVASVVVERVSVDVEGRLLGG